MDIMGTLKQKIAGVQIWIWTLLFTAALALYLARRQKRTKSADQAAASQTSTDLGSASALANTFGVAGQMPYQGGNVYVNTGPASTTPAAAGTKTINIESGATIDQVIQRVRSLGGAYKNFSWADFLALNPNVVKAANLEYIPASPAREAAGLGPDYKFTNPVTTVIIGSESTTSLPPINNYPQPRMARTS